MLNHYVDILLYVLNAYEAGYKICICTYFSVYFINITKSKESQKKKFCEELYYLWK